MAAIFLTDLREALDRRRVASRSRRQLQRDLAAYDDAGRLDLQATLARYPGEQTVELQTLLVR
ncbi:MAG: hypothetical protein JWM76_1068 [Pseudonocardiales bacterium]|nr:hypothetical protein [Pseudonocardiales bacterium]